jgi:hypothetical protein
MYLPSNLSNFVTYAGVTLVWGTVEFVEFVKMRLTKTRESKSLKPLAHRVRNSQLSLSPNLLLPANRRFYRWREWMP